SELLNRWKDDSIPVGILIIGTGGFRMSTEGVIGSVTGSGFRLDFLPKGWLIFPFTNAVLDYTETNDAPPDEFPELQKFVCCLVIRHFSGEMCALFEMWSENEFIDETPPPNLGHTENENQ